MAARSYLKASLLGGSSSEKACDIARGGGRACADARRIYLEFQHRLGLGLAPLLPLLWRVHAPLPVRLLSLLALPASLGRLRLVLAEPLPCNFGKCANHALFARSLRSRATVSSPCSGRSASGGPGTTTDLDTKVAPAYRGFFSQPPAFPCKGLRRHFAVWIKSLAVLVAILLASWSRRLLSKDPFSSPIGICFGCPPLLVALFAQSVLNRRMRTLAGPMAMRFRLALTLLFVHHRTNSNQGPLGFSQYTSLRSAPSRQPQP